MTVAPTASINKLRIKSLLLITFFFLHFLLISSCAKLDAETENTYTPEISQDSYDIVLEKETDHFIIRYFSDSNYNDRHIKCIDDIALSLENDRVRLKKLYGEDFKDKKIVEVHDGLSHLHEAMGMPDASGWVLGGYSYGKILIVSPLLNSSNVDYDSMIKSTVHEYVHLIIRKINPETPRWLNEGIAYYEAKDHALGQINRAVKSSVASGTVPELNYFKTEDYNLFANRNGYQYMYTLVEYIIDEYGYDKLLDLINSPNSIKPIFGITEDELYRNWVSFLEDNYL